MNLQQALTDAQPIPGSVKRYWDDLVTGLGLRISGGGKRVYIVRREGSRVDERIADAGQITLDTARQIALAVRAGRDGGDGDIRSGEQSAGRASLPRLLRAKEVLDLTGISHSGLYARINKGTFPAPVKIGPKTARWREDEIAEWLETVTAQRSQPDSQLRCAGRGGR